MADERKKGEKGGEREDVPRGERAGGEALCTVGRGGGCGGRRDATERAI